MVSLDVIASAEAFGGLSEFRRLGGSHHAGTEEPLRGELLVGSCRAVFFLFCLTV